MYGESGDFDEATLRRMRNKKKEVERDKEKTLNMKRVEFTRLMVMLIPRAVSGNGLNEKERLQKFHTEMRHVQGVKQNRAQ